MKYLFVDMVKFFLWELSWNITAVGIQTMARLPRMPHIYLPLALIFNIEPEPCRPSANIKTLDEFNFCFRFCRILPFPFAGDCLLVNIFLLSRFAISLPKTSFFFRVLSIATVGDDLPNTVRKTIVSKGTVTTFASFIVTDNIMQISHISQLYRIFDPCFKHWKLVFICLKNPIKTDRYRTTCRSFPLGVCVNREVKHDVFGKRQTAKMNFYRLSSALRTLESKYLYL